MRYTLEEREKLVFLISRYLQVKFKQSGSMQEAMREASLIYLNRPYQE